MDPRCCHVIRHYRRVMSRTLKILLPLAVLVVVGVYLAGSFAGASEGDPPPREPVVLPSDTSTPTPSNAPSGTPSSGAPTTGSPGQSSRVPVITPGPVDDDDDDDDDDRDDDD